VTHQDWLPPDGRTTEEYLRENPEERRKRRQLEKWKAERIAAHRRMLRLFQQGDVDPNEPPPAVPKPRWGSAWS
jgi:hypothetical protein